MGSVIVLYCCMILYLSYPLAVFCVSEQVTNGHFWPWWFISNRGKEHEGCCFFFVWGGGSWQSWKGRVGTSGWQPVAIFLTLSMRMLSRTKSREARTRSRTSEATRKEKLSATHVKNQSIAKLAFGQYLRTNWQMSKGFDSRVFWGGRGGANTDVLWLLCGFECFELWAANK